MRMVDIIEKKKRGGALNAEEIRWFVAGYTAGDIPDYQAAALCMAIWFRGMDAAETAALTLAMADSGDRVDLSALPGRKVDKHSTGGVGDTTTLVAAPLAAACGITIAKMSGRGLGHTGGTLDKLESIPGLSTAQSPERFFAIARSAGLAVVGQTGNLTPADKLLYGLRDATATVDSLPLIAASIMSKKLAAGCDAIVLDVKVGSGAFMGALEDARALAAEMVALGREARRQTVAYLTDMNQPLGRAVGNALEVAEAVEILQGHHGQGRLCTLAVELGAEMLTLGGAARSMDEARKRLRGAIASGEGLRALRAMVDQMGGDTTYIDNPNKLYYANHTLEVTAQRDGYLSAIDVREAGRAAQALGAGRDKKDDVIDPAVGYVMHKELGDAVKKGESLATLYYNDAQKAAAVTTILHGAISIAEDKPSIGPLIYDIIRK